jgi:hypothetical protein
VKRREEKRSDKRGMRLAALYSAVREERITADEVHLTAQQCISQG